jgi:hypothetical protein
LVDLGLIHLFPQLPEMVDEFENREQQRPFPTKHLSKYAIIVAQ